VRDKQGKKMSKSSGNGLDPIEVINEYGADALRLSLVAGTAPGADFRIYPEKIAGYRNFVNKLWNIARFIFSSVAVVQRVKVRPQAVSLADAWILSEYDLLVKEITSDFHNWRLAPAIEKLYNFTWSKLADWYLEVVKIEKNINPASVKTKDEILLYLLEGLLKLWHPFTPFVTEVLWRQFKPEHLLVIEHWPKAEEPKQESIKNFTELQELVTQIRNLKAANKIAPQQKPPCQLSSIILSKTDLEVVARLARVELVSDLTNAQTINIGQSTIIIDLNQGLSDKERQSLTDYCAKLKIQLSNKDFINNAPRQVVDDLKEKLKQAEKKLSK
jgi:valyl-tRNA synthetase